MSKLAQYISRVSKEDAELEEAALTPEEVTAAEVVEEAELEVPVAEEVTEEQVEEAVEVAEVAKEELDEITEETAETEAAAADVEEELTSIEEFAAVLQHGIKTQTYSPQFAAICQAKLVKLHKTFGEEPSVSLEDFSGESLNQYYVASLESFGGFLKRVGDVSARIGSYLPDLLASGKLVVGYTNRAKGVHAIVDSLSAKLADLPADAKFVGSVNKVLVVDGANDFFSGINADLRLTSASVTKGLPANEKLLSSLVSILAKAVTEGGVGKTGAIIAEVGKIQSASKAYPEAAFTTGFAGGSKLGKAEDAAEDADTRGKLAFLVGGAVPSVIKGKTEKLEGVELNKAAIGKVIALAKVYAELGIKAAQSSGVKALEQNKQLKGVATRSFSAQSNGGAQTTSWSEGKDLDILTTSLPKIVGKHVALYRFIAEHAVLVAEGLSELVERALEKAAAPEKAAE